MTINVYEENYGTSQRRNELETKIVTKMSNTNVTKEIQIKELEALTGVDSFCAILWENSLSSLKKQTLSIFVA